jgi:hypothetical protein
MLAYRVTSIQVHCTNAQADSRPIRPGTWQASKPRSEQHVAESAVLPSEIEQLPPLAGYLKLASSPSWRRVGITRS